MRQKAKSHRVLAFVVGCLISGYIGTSWAFQQPQTTAGNRIRTLRPRSVMLLPVTRNDPSRQTCLHSAHHNHNHDKMTWRDMLIGSSPLIKTFKYVYNRTRIARWLRAKRKKQREEDAHSGISEGFVDAAHSPWASRFCTIYISIYMLLSVVAYSFIFEKWSIINSLYFATTTFTSVGYGDLCPQTRGGRLFTVFFALYGISILGIALGYIGRNLVEAEAGAVEAAEQRIVDALQGRFHRHNDTIAANATAISSFTVPGDNITIPHIRPTPKPTLMSVLRHLVLTQAPNILLIMFFAGIMGRHEGWGWWTSVYYAFITTTTVGLGDIAPASQAARLFAVIFIPLSVAILGEILSVIGGFLVTKAAHKAEHEFLSREMTFEDLKTMDDNNDGKVSEVEFITHMLVSMDKCDQELINELRELFVQLDAQSNGVLEPRDFEILAQRKRNRLRQMGSTVRQGEYV